MAHAEERLRALPRNGCRYITGDVRFDDDWAFCGKPCCAKPDGTMAPWCKAHFKLCVKLVPPRVVLWSTAA